MLNNQEYGCLIHHLHPKDKMLEWGSGWSTVILPYFLNQYYSIEHHPTWFKIAVDRLPENVQLFLRLPNKPRTQPTKREEFKDYVEVVHELDHVFDKVLIDGRARVDCGIEVLPYLQPHALVFVHDFQRSRYKPLLEYYDLVDEEDTLVVLKAKNG